MVCVKGRKKLRVEMVRRKTWERFYILLVLEVVRLFDNSRVR
jgi:hypothetical protein